jgi:hypothetical protein
MAESILRPVCMIKQQYADDLYVPTRASPKLLHTDVKRRVEVYVVGDVPGCKHYVVW